MAEYSYPTYQAPPMPGWPGFLLRAPDNASVPCSLTNQDYQNFLVWLTEGNTAPEGWTGPTNTTPATG